jgi:hypothetical protein
MEGVITLAHGNGGRLMRELIAEVFARHLANENLDIAANAALLPPSEGSLVWRRPSIRWNPAWFGGLWAGRGGWLAFLQVAERAVDPDQYQETHLRVILTYPSGYTAQLTYLPRRCGRFFCGESEVLTVSLPL